MLRETHDELMRERGNRVGELLAQVAALKKERARLYDLIFKHQFGEQVFDSLPVPEVSAEPLEEPELTADQKAEEEVLDGQREERRRLTSLRRTSPSRLGRELERAMTRRSRQAAIAAHPAAGVFQNAKAQVLSSIPGKA